MFKPDNRKELLSLLGALLLLFGLTYGLLGFYYETNDDQIITLLLRGVAIRPALSDLSLYFFGWSQLITWLYGLLPQVPWYGLVLYGWLLVATLVACRGLLRAFPRLPPWQRWGLLLAFYIGCWLEHVMWFNYLRVSLLLAGASFLFLLQVPEKPSRGWAWLLAGLLFAAALCIRPSAAALGLLVVGPAALILGCPLARPKRAWLACAFLLAWGLAFWGWQQARQTPAARQYQALDLWKSAVLDYGIYQPRLHSRADSLAYAAIGHWFLADRQVLPATFYRQQGRISLAYIFRQAAPQKLAALLQALGRDQFLLLWGNALLIAWIWRGNRPLRWRLLGYEAYFWLLLLAIGIGLKLPPRVLTPCLSLYTLVHLLLWAKVEKGAGPGWFKLAWIITGLAGLAYLGKVSHRAQFQQQRQRAHEQFIGELARASRGRVLVYSALPEYFRSLSPWRNYQFGARVLLPITGWSTLDPAYRGFYRRQTGQADLVPALLALSRQQGTLWVLEPGFYRFLQAYVRTFYGASLLLEPQDSLLGRYPVKVYRGRAPSGR